MIVRRCTVEDIDSVYEAEKESFADPIKKETFEKDFERESYCCYGAFENELLAFVSVEKVLDEGQIISVATKEKYRRQKVAKRLFEEVIELLKKSGINCLTLEVRCDNVPALKLYESIGFKKVGLRKNYYTNPLCDAVLMDLQIGDEN